MGPQNELRENVLTRLTLLLVYHRTLSTVCARQVPAAPMPTFEKSCYGAVGGACSFSHRDPYELFADEFKVKCYYEKDANTGC